MAWDELKFRISADMDFGEALSQVENIKKGIDGLKDTITDMPNVSKILDNSLNKTATIAESLSKKMVALRNGDYKSEKERKSLENSIQQDVFEINTMRSLQSGEGDFSVSLARSWFGGLPQAVQKELDSVIPQVASVIRTRMSSLNGLDSNKFNGKTKQSIATEAMKDLDIKRIASENLKLAESKRQFRSLVEDIVPHVVSANKLDTYQIRRFGSTIQNERAALSKGETINLFPESYKASYRNHGYARRTFEKDEGDKVLSSDAISEINRMLASRPIMAKAAIESGISRRDRRGVLETRKEITHNQWENFRESLYDELVTRVAGYGKGKIDPYSVIDEDVRKIESRLTSSTSGRTMATMHDIEQFENAANWVNGTGSNRYTKIKNEGRRAMDEYVTLKYSPFIKRPDGSSVAPREVMINESHNTRLLGNGKWRNNDDVSDTIRLISLEGYDPSDKAQKEKVYDIFKNGQVYEGEKYVAQSLHGKGEDQVIRMIKESAYNRVNEKENAWAKTRGISGTYWKGFEDAEIQRKIDNGTITVEDWGKHLEMLNKAWTPTTDIGADLSNVRVAVVKYDKKGDGAAYATNRVMPDSGQIRLGVGGKGSMFVIDAKDIGDFGRKTGIADENGRVWQKGLNGELFDVSDYDILLPEDVIKNIGAFKDANGNFYSGERTSEIATALVRRYGIGMLANYVKEDNHSRKLGTQMASFISMSPELSKHQADAAAKRLQELDTEAGQLKYVFGDKDSDHLSRLVNENRQLLSTSSAQRRIEAEKQKIIQGIIGGQYQSFDEESGISDMRLVASPLASYFMSHGRIGKETIKKARQAFARYAKQNGIETPQYTDQEIMNMIVPDKNTVLDFAHMDSDEVSVIRSPTGYGNMVNAKNIASAALPLYKAFGLPTNAGIYVSEDQLKVLQSADYDSDEAKVIFKATEYSEALRKSIEKTLETQKYEEAVIKTTDAKFSKEELADPILQQVEKAGRASIQGIPMGVGSSGIRIMQLDLNNPINKEYVKQAQRLAAYYDNGTVYDKKAKEMSLEDVNAWNALKLGKEFTKFSDKAGDLFTFEDDLKDINDNPDESAKEFVYKASNGLLVNLRRLQQMGVDNINLPSAFMSNHLMGVGTIGRLYREGLVDTRQMDAISEAMDQIGYGDAGPARQKLMQTMRHMLPEFGSGKRMMLTPAETRALTAMKDSAEIELRETAKDFYDENTGKYVLNGNTYDNEFALNSAREKFYGINTARNAINSFGLTEGRLKFLFGDSYKDMFKNVGTSLIDLLPEDAVVQETEKQIENVQNEIEELAKKSVEEATKKYRPKKGTKSEGSKELTAEQHKINTDIEEYENKLNVHSRKELQEAFGDLERAAGVLEFQKQKTGIGPEYALEKQRYDSRQQDLERLNVLYNRKEFLDSASPTTRKLSDAKFRLTELEDLKAEQIHAVDTRTAFQQTIAEMNQYLQKAISSWLGKENQLDETKTYAERQWGRSQGLMKAALKPAQMMKENLINEGYTREGKDGMIKDIEYMEYQIEDIIGKDFADKAVLYAKNTAEKIKQKLDKTQNNPSKQKLTLDSFDKEITDAQSFIDLINEKLEKDVIPDHLKKAFSDSAKSAAEYISEAQTSKEALTQEYIKENEKQADLSMESLEGKLGYRDKNSFEVRKELRQRDIDTLREKYEHQHREKLLGDEKYQSLIDKLDMYQENIDPDLRRLDALYQERSGMQYNQLMRKGNQIDRSRYGLNRGTIGIIGRGLSQRDSILSAYESYKYEIDSRLEKERTSLRSEKDPQKIEETSNRIKELEQASQSAGKAIESLSGPMGAASGVAMQLGNSISMLMARFGRQLFSKAINEAKQFVQQYDKMMTEIQMITLKSNDQMNQVGDSIVSKAKDMKISISEIAQSAATLYRQGLNDQEVSERLGVVSKFSKVSGTNVKDATKLITVALNTGLVSNAMEASDIVTALGDNAATNAQQIEKGIEKAGAAAAADGTTFGQLASMLTAIISTTQIGGSVAGRTLNTVFGRMNKIGTNELLIDENGNAISGAAVATLLKQQGIEQYQNGKKRSSFDVLYELSQKWDTLDDAVQQQFATAIAGTRQYSNFAAIMQGMSEGKVDEYLNLVGESSGMTDKKFDIYTKSLQASLTDVKNAFDSSINDMVDTGALKEILTFVKDAITGFGKLGSTLKGLNLVPLAGLAILMGYIRGSFAGAIAAAGLVTAIGISAAVGSGINAAEQNNVNASEVYSKYNQKASETYSSRMQSIARLKELGGQESRTEAENKEMLYIANNLSNMTGTSTQVDKLSSAIDKLGSSADSATSEISDLTKDIAGQAEKETNQRQAYSAYNAFNEGKGAKNILDQVENSTKEFIDTSRAESIKDAYSMLLSADKDGLSIDLADEIGEFSEENFRKSLKKLQGTYFGNEKANAYKNSLATAFSEMDDNFFKDENLKGKSKEEWNDILNNYIEYMWQVEHNVPESAIKEMPEVYNSSILMDSMIKEIMPYISNEQAFKGSAREKQKEAYKNALQSILYDIASQGTFNSEYVPSLAQRQTEQLFSELKLDEVGRYIMPTEEELIKKIQTFLGYNGIDAISIENLRKAVQAEAEAGGYTVSANEKIAQEELANISGSGYFINTKLNRGDKGYIVSSEDAYEMLKNGKGDYLQAVYGNALTDASYTMWAEDKSNKKATTADNLIRAITKSGATNIADIIDFIESDKTVLGQLKSLYHEDVNFQKIMSQISRNEETGEIAAPDEIVEQIYDYLYSTGSDYGKRREISEKRGDLVAKAIKGMRYEGWYESQSAYNEAATSEEGARTDKYITDLTSAYMTEILGEELTNRIKSGTSTYQDYVLAQTLAFNYKSGIVGLTQQNKMDQLSVISDLMQNNPEKLKQYWQENEYSAKQYGSGFSDFATMMGLATKDERNEQEQNAFETLKARFENYLREYNVSTVTDKLEAGEKNGTYRTGTADLYRKLVSPNAQDVRSAEQSIASEYSNILKVQAATSGLSVLSAENWNINKGEHLSQIASFLGWTDEQKKYYEDYSKRNEVIEKVNERIAEFIKQMIDLSSQFTDTDLSDVESLPQLFDKLSESSDNASDALLTFINSLTGLTAKTTLSDIFDNNAYEQQIADRQTLANIVQNLSAGQTIKDLIGPEKIFADEDVLKDFVGRNSQVQDIFNKVWTNKNRQFTQQDVDALKELSVYGFDNVNTAYLNNYNKLNSFRTENGFNAEKVQAERLINPEFDEFVKSLPYAEDALNGDTKALKLLNAELYDGANKALKAFGTQTDKVSEKGKKLRGSIEDQNEAMKSYRTNISKILNNQSLRTAFREGKKSAPGLQSYVESLGFNKKDLEDFSMRKKILEAMKLDEAADSSAYEEEIGAFFGSMSDDFNKYVKENPIDIEGFDINVESGSVNVSTDQLLAQFGSALENTQTAAINEALSKGVEIQWNVNWDNEKTTITPIVNELGRGKNTGGGGGGGGKSAVDRLLEAQKRRLAPLEHKQKLLEIKENEYNFDNNYSAWEKNINQQIKLQEKLTKAYQKNIKELKEMLKNTKKGTSDWYKIKDAINAAEESLAGVTSKINDLNMKRISILEEKYTNKSKYSDHKRNMLSKYAQNALDSDRYNDYVKVTKTDMTEIENRKSKNAEAIAEWKKVLAKAKKYSDEWYAARDQIFALEEQNADLDNEYLQKRLELARQQLSQVAKVLQQNTQTETHNKNVAGMYGDYYLSGGYRQEYEKTIKINAMMNDELLRENMKAAEDARKVMAEEEKAGRTGSTIWFEAQAAVYQYDETIAQLLIDQVNLNKALAESKIDEIAETYADMTRGINSANEALSKFAQQALDRNDYIAYVEAMNMYIDNLPYLIEEASNRIAGLQAQYEIGMQNGDLDKEMQRKLLDEINEAIAEKQDLEIEYERKNRELQKARLDQLLEEQQYVESNYEHNQKLLGYQGSKYQSNGELTNYMTVLEADTDLRTERIEQLYSEIEELEALRQEVDSGSDQEQRIVEAIKKKEEAIASENVQIEKNNKLIEENISKIRQLQKALEDSVDKEIENQKKRAREILSANVSMQNSIVDVLKKRLTEEWNLKKKDIDKEKESLNEYKKLINERFNYRKKASQQADKDEELASYRRQLALIEADPTRSKDAKELRKKIEDLEKERAWTISEDELNAENERVDNQIEGMTKFVQYNEELLNEILSDANNFSVEMNEILTGSFEESYNKILEFMSKENEAFVKSLPDAQQQMIQSWEDTWKKANDIIDSNYAEIKENLGIFNEDGSLMSYDEIINGNFKDQYIEWMKENDRTYRSYFETGDQNSMKIMEKTWSDYFDNFLDSIKDDAVIEIHEHVLGDVVSKLDELKDNIFQVEIVDITGTPIAPYGLEGGSVDTVDYSTGKVPTINSYTNIGKTSTNSGNSGSGSGGNSGKTGGGSGSSSNKPSQANLRYGYTTADPKGYPKSEGGTVYAPNTATAMAKARVQIAKNWKDRILDYVYHYKLGGDVDYTGLAWVDGTKTRPEAFLGAEDRESMRTMLDAMNYVRTNPFMSHVDASNFAGDTNVGDINIVINQADLKSDADVDKLARQVGEAFSRELQRNGLNLSGYSFG